MTKHAKKIEAATKPVAALVTADLEVLATADIGALSTASVEVLTTMQAQAMASDEAEQLAAAEVARLETEARERQRLEDLHIESEICRMQNMAQSIWDGQSSSLPNKDRKERIYAGLMAQGFEPLMGYLRAPEGYESAE